ncbi:oxidoreductase [Rhodotorula diobovata]|uniref:Oxidoreductase n=1 Tax=Rhodotorula diobovata TaxID=5288 RepID=A0A5C5FSK4_9BASI|nr:oxidoreductase [Rhodotorula diobovata]
MAQAERVVLVTGSSEGGIGYALCQEFDKQGCIVYASARRLEAIASLPESVHKIALDVTSLESCESAVKRIIAEQGRIDVLVNNAGMGGVGAMLDVDVESDKGAKATFETNVWAPIRLSKVVAPHMVEAGSGLIINIGSIVGNIPTPWAGVYAASKAALHSMTETLRMEVEGFGIKVMLVAPGAITSNFGTKHKESLTLPDDSLYQQVKDMIYKRADISQTPGRTTPAPVLAKQIVACALRRPTPARYYTGGANSWLFWIFERLPRPLVWMVLRRSLGTDRVKPLRAKRA